MIHPCTDETIHIIFMNSQNNAKYCYVYNLHDRIIKHRSRYAHEVHDSG